MSRAPVLTFASPSNSRSFSMNTPQNSDHKIRARSKTIMESLVALNKERSKSDTPMSTKGRNTVSKTVYIAQLKVKWKRNNNDDIQWHDEHRLLLVRAVKHNRDILSDNKTRAEKRSAWSKVHKEMVSQHGMPVNPGSRYPAENVRKEWGRILEKYNNSLQGRQSLSAVEMAVQKVMMKSVHSLQNATILTNATALKATRQSPRILNRTATVTNTPASPMVAAQCATSMVQCTSTVTRTPSIVRRTSTITRTIGAHGNTVQFDNGLQLAPITPKRRELNDPVVLLTDVAHRSPPVKEDRHAQIINDIAKKDLNYKTALLRNEDEKMEYNREIFRKQLTLLDLQIQRAQIDLNSSTLGISRI